MGIFNIGPVAVDTIPFSADEWDHAGSADFAVKPVVGRQAPLEFMGAGEETITLRGQLLPSKIGGLTGLATLHGFRRSGEAVPVMRGDGLMMGWYVITRIEQGHRDIERNGVGFSVTFTVEMMQSDPASAAPNLVGLFLSLFEAVGR